MSYEQRENLSEIVASDLMVSSSLVFPELVSRVSPSTSSQAVNMLKVIWKISGATWECFYDMSVAQLPKARMIKHVDSYKERRRTNGQINEISRW